MKTLHTESHSAAFQCALLQTETQRMDTQILQRFLTVTAAEIKTNRLKLPESTIKLAEHIFLDLQQPQDEGFIQICLDIDEFNPNLHSVQRQYPEDDPNHHAIVIVLNMHYLDLDDWLCENPPDAMIAEGICTLAAASLALHEDLLRCPDKLLHRT